MSKTEQRRSYITYMRHLQEKATRMGNKMVPKHCYLPAIDRMITAGQEASVMRTVRAAFNQNPETEFPQSFQSWSPRTAREIIHWEIVPTIHERINVRALMTTSPPKS